MSFTLLGPYSVMHAIVAVAVAVAVVVVVGFFFFFSSSSWEIVHHVRLLNTNPICPL